MLKWFWRVPTWTHYFKGMLSHEKQSRESKGSRTYFEGIIRGIENELIASGLNEY